MEAVRSQSLFFIDHLYRWTSWGAEGYVAGQGSPTQEPAEPGIRHRVVWPLLGATWPGGGWNHTPSQDLSPQPSLEHLSLKSSPDQFFSIASPWGLLRAQRLWDTQFASLHKKFQEGTFQIPSPHVDIRMIVYAVNSLNAKQRGF